MIGMLCMGALALIEKADQAMRRLTGGARGEQSQGRRSSGSAADRKRSKILRKLGIKRGRGQRSSIERSSRRERQLLQKATGPFLSTDLSTSGGLLVDEQQDSFIRTVIEQSTLLPVVRTIPMTSPTRRIERIAFLSRTLKPVTEFTAPGVTNKPDLAKILLETFEFGALFTISYDTLEQNLESNAPNGPRGSRFEQTLLQIIAERVAVDIEDYVLNSDTASVDPDFDEFDGFLKLASNKFDALGAPVSKGLFKSTLTSLPKKFRLRKNRMAWMYGASTETEWRDEFADRGTAFGDQAMADGDQPDRRYGAYGIRAMQVPVMPEELGAGLDEGKILLTDPRNMIVGLHRNVFFDWDKDIEARALKIMVTARFGAKYEDPDGAAVGESYKVA